MFSPMVGDHSADDGSDVGSITIALYYFRPTAKLLNTPQSADAMVRVSLFGIGINQVYAVKRSTFLRRRRVVCR